MSQPLTADDVLPLVAKLSGDERRRLLRMIMSPASDAAVYKASTPVADEFGADDDSLAWDAAGWEDVG